VPLIVIDGKFVVSTEKVGSHAAMIPVMDALIAKARAERPKSWAVFITGASSGIGAALARHYAAQAPVSASLARRRDALDLACRRAPGGTGRRVRGRRETPPSSRRAASRFQRALRDRGGRHRQRGHLARNADRARRGRPHVPARSSTST
jgi:NAD(P)-dependent dehydrogenase (short-subunit alcohol dehydrogenase family)